MAANGTLTQKTELSRFARALCVAHIHIQRQYRTSHVFSKPSQQ